MKKVFVIFCICLFVVPVSAQDSTTAYDESWYTYWGLGFSRISYPEGKDTYRDWLLEQSDFDRLSIAIDMLGFYWPISEKTILGFIVNGAGDNFTREEKVDSYGFTQEKIGVNYLYYTYAGSVIHYLTDNFGSGIFLRGDVGISVKAVKFSGTAASLSYRGFGILIGSGWSFDFGGTRLLLNINYAFRSFGEDSNNIVVLTVGGLF